MRTLGVKRLLTGFSLFSFILIIFFTGGKDTFWNSIALGGLMVFFWLFELLPIYVTALFPFVLGIPLGVLDSTDLTSAYGHKYIYLFFGGFVLSVALEKWDVHKQIAEGILDTVGTSKTRVLLGFLLTTMILSMWISNTATSLMMLPMALAITSNMKFRKGSRFPILLLLSIAYGASIGGMSTLVGSPPNIAMAGILEERFNTEISFFDWMSVGLPVSIVMISITFLFFYFLLGKDRKVKLEHVKNAREKWTTDQLRVIALFLFVVILWAFRGPITRYTGILYTDEGVAVMGAILLFFIPSKKSATLLEWKDTRKIAWGILILFGGGMALATMFDKNGVIDFVASAFHNFSGASILVMTAILVFISIFGTELMSNLALVSVLVPVVAQFALDTDVDILQLCLPITLASSCAFMLPVGTPPNAIVFSSGQLKIEQMAKYGLVLNTLGVIVITILVTMLL
jgi:sodium-dependent dicarboxylate transporter 2/3/5